MIWLGMGKGDGSYLLDKVWGREGLTGDDHNLAAPTGRNHAEIGISQAMPETASQCLSSLKAQKIKSFRHWMQNYKGYHFHVVGFC